MEGFSAAQYEAMAKARAGINLTVSGLDAEQRDNIVHALKTHYVTPVAEGDIEITSYPGGTWGVGCKGFFASSQLASILLDEDSGADYLT